jgi:hypothetical protein
MNIYRFLKHSTLAPLCIALSLAAPQKSLAIEPATATAATGAVVAVMQAIGGLTKWIEAQSNDVAAAVLAAEYGAHGGSQETTKDTGFYNVFVSKGVNGIHGRSDAIALAQEGFFGRTLSGSTTKAIAFAAAYPLHTIPSKDEHHAKAFASASVDGRIETSTKESQPVSVNSPPTLDPDWSYTPPSASQYDVWLTVAFPTGESLLRAGVSPTPSDEIAAAISEWSYSVLVNGVPKFYAALTLDWNGIFNITSISDTIGLESTDVIRSSSGSAYDIRLIPNQVINGINYNVTDIKLGKQDPDTLFQWDIEISSTASASADLARVPGPLPIAGVCVSLAYSRKIRRRISAARKPTPNLNVSDRSISAAGSIPIG